MKKDFLLHGLINIFVYYSRVNKPSEYISAFSKYLYFSLQQIFQPTEIFALVPISWEDLVCVCAFQVSQLSCLLVVASRAIGICVCLTPLQPGSLWGCISGTTGWQAVAEK